MSPLRFFLPALLLAAFAGGSLRADAPATPAATATAPTLERTTLLAGLAADLAAHYALTDTLDVDLLRPWTAPAAAAGGEKAAPVTIDVVDYPEVLASSMLVRVRYRQDDRILREDTLALRASLWRDALVASNPLKRSDAVSTDVMTTRRVDALRDRDALPVSSAGDDYVLAREVPAGRTLTWRDVVRRSLVHRGQTVEVLASDGLLVITIKALAMQDGARGESVRVRNVESKREFIAKVTAENRAEVRF